MLAAFLIVFLAAAPSPEWTVSEGYAMEKRGSATVLAPEHVGTEGALTRRIDAAPWRGKIFRATAVLHTGGNNPRATARLWMRSVRANQSAGSLLDYISGDPVRASEWTPAEVSGPIPNDAKAIEFGLASNGYDEVWIADVSPGGPRNLDFSRGHAEWKFPGEISAEGCMEAPRCAVLTKPGSIEQSFSAEGWHDSPIQLKAWVEFEPASPDDTAEIFLRSESPSGENTVWYRTIHETEWIDAEITHAIRDDAASIGIGFSQTGGHLSVEQISVQPVPAPGPAAPAPPPPPAAIDIAPVAGPSPSEQQKLIDQASRRAAAYISGLPDFICTQIVSRWQKRGDGLFVKKDVLTVRLGYSEGSEHYKLTAIDDRPTNASYKSMGGAVSEGEFGSVLREIFAPATAKFRWPALTPCEVGPYTFSATPFHRKNRNTRYTTVLPMPMNPPLWFPTTESFSSIAIRVTSCVSCRFGDMPAGFAVRSASTVVDYEFAELGDPRFTERKSYLLPLRSETTVGTDSIQTRNETEFRGYRKFDADVTITFDTPQ